MVQGGIWEAGQSLKLGVGVNRLGEEKREKKMQIETLSVIRTQFQLTLYFLSNSFVYTVSEMKTARTKRPRTHSLWL